MAAPPSQKYRQIGFHLTGGSGQAVQFTFGIRPEDLTRQEPSRLAVQQTLGGAWADVFGAGVSSITLSGHNGWRGGLLVSGEDLFQALRKTVFQAWHDRRKQAIAAGQDPAGVQLYFSDALDNINLLVAPRSFGLRRSRASPLLIRYQIALLVLDDAAGPVSILDSIINALSNPMAWLAGVTGLGDTLAMVNDYATQAENVLGAVGGAVRGFVNVGASLIQGVAGAAQDAAGQFEGSVSSLLSIGSLYSRAACNGFAGLADDDTLSSQDRIPLMALSSLFNGAACTMDNCFDLELLIRDFAAIYGASGCSSTSGGDPPSQYTLTGGNPFDDIIPAGPSPVTVTADGQAALATLAGDPLLLVGQQATVGSLMARAAAGVSVP